MSGKDENAGDVMMKVDPKRGGKHMAIKGQGVEEGGLLSSRLEVILMAISRASHPFRSTRQRSHMGLKLRLDEIDHAGGNNHFIRFVLTVKGGGVDVERWLRWQGLKVEKSHSLVRKSKQVHSEAEVSCLRVGWTKRETWE